MVDGVAPPISERHRHWFHRRSPIKEPVRVATTASITIATDLNVGDTIDGVTLADGDRVLVKNQSTGSQNGIYNAGASPSRAYDVSTDDPAFGYVVLVLQGTTNAGTLWQNTNMSAPTIGSTSLTFVQLAPSSAYTLTIKDEGSPLATGATSIDFVGSGVVASGTGAAKTVTIPGGASALDDLTDVTITTPSSDQTLIYNGSQWINTSAIWRPLMDGAGAVITDGGTGEAIMALS